MALRLTERDKSGTIHLRARTIPLVVAAIIIPILTAILLGALADAGIGLGLAAGALAVTALIVIAGRAAPDGPIEVAPRRDAARRVLVLAAAEPTPSVVERVAEEAEGADDVRLVVPVRGRKIDRWLSATDDDRERAQDALARTAGVLVAAGLPVSGALGDGDLGQALEDELRGFSADRVIVLADPGDELPTATAARLGVPIVTVAAPPSD
jgi:hypothetical protein